MWSVGTTVFIITVASAVRAPLLPEIGGEFSLSATQLGLITTFFAVGRLIADLPAARLTDEIPIRRMLWISSAIVAAASFLFAGAQIVAMIFLAAALGGVGSAWTNTTGLAFFASATEGSRRGTSVSLYATALLAGQAVGPALGGAVEGLGGWRLSFVAAAVLAAVATATAYAAPARRAAGTGDRSDSRRGRDVPSRYIAVIYALPALQFAIGGALMQTLFPIIGSEELGLTAGAIGLALGVGGVARVAGALLGGQLSDRVGRRVALITGLVVQTIGIALAALSPTTVSWVWAIGLTSLGSIGVPVGATVLGDLSASGGLGKRLGVFRFAGDTGFLVGPLVAGLAYDLVGRAGAVLPFAAATVGVAIAAAVVLPETRPRSG